MMRKLCLFLILTTALAFSCQKKTDVPDPISVTYNCYSENGNFVLTYMDANSDWQKETISAVTYSKTIEITDDQLFFSTMMDANQSDSMSISGTYNGKRADDSFRSNAGAFSVAIQLSQAK